jgi:hypothetical protein
MFRWAQQMKSMLAIVGALAGLTVAAVVVAPWASADSGEIWSADFGPFYCYQYPLNQSNPIRVLIRSTHAYQLGSGYYFFDSRARYEDWSQKLTGYTPRNDDTFPISSDALDSRPSASWTPDQFCQAIAHAMDYGASFPHSSSYPYGTQG